MAPREQRYFIDGQWLTRDQLRPYAGPGQTVDDVIDYYNQGLNAWGPPLPGDVPPGTKGVPDWAPLPLSNLQGGGTQIASLSPLSPAPPTAAERKADRYGRGPTSGGGKPMQPTQPKASDFDTNLDFRNRLAEQGLFPTPTSGLDVLPRRFNQPGYVPVWTPNPNEGYAPGSGFPQVASSDPEMFMGGMGPSPPPPGPLDVDPYLMPFTVDRSKLPPPSQNVDDRRGQPYPYLPSEAMVHPNFGSVQYAPQPPGETLTMGPNEEAVSSANYTNPVGGSQAGNNIWDPKAVPYSGGHAFSRSFGGPRGGNRHTAVDIPAEVGDPIYAVQDGVIRRNEKSSSGYGYVVDIEYPDGSVHRMAHLNGAGPYAVGTSVPAGTEIAKAGHSGNAKASFTHVHYEVINTPYYNAQGGLPPGRASMGELAAGRQDPRLYFAGYRGPDAAKQFQRDAQAAGYYDGAIDGVAGPGTEGALEQMASAGAIGGLVGAPSPQAPQAAPSALAGLTAPGGGTEVTSPPSPIQSFAPSIESTGLGSPAQTAITEMAQGQPQPLQLPPQWNPATGFPVDMPVPPSRGQGMANLLDRTMFAPDRPGGMSPGPRQRPSTFDWMGGGAPDAGAVPLPGISPLRPAFGGPGDRRPQPPMPPSRPGDPTPYDTDLTPSEDAAFQAWKQQYAPGDPGADYDYRGAFKEGFTPGPDGHWFDTFKKPSHPTFSDESIYAKDQPGLAGHWSGDTYVPPDAFMPPPRPGNFEYMGGGAPVSPPNPSMRPQPSQSLVAGRPEYPGQMPAAPFQTPYGGRPPIPGASPGGMPGAPPSFHPLASARMNLPPPLPTWDENASRLQSDALARELGFNRRQMEGYTRPPPSVGETLAMGPNEEPISALPPISDPWARAYSNQRYGTVPANWGDPSNIPTVSERFDESVGPTQATVDSRPGRTIVTDYDPNKPMVLAEEYTGPKVAAPPVDPQVTQAQTQPRTARGRYAEARPGFGTGFGQRMMQSFIPGGSFLGPNAVFGLGNAGSFTPSGAGGTSFFNQQPNGAMGTTTWRQGSVTGNPSMGGVMWNRSGDNGSVGYVTNPFNDSMIYSGSPNRF